VKVRADDGTVVGLIEQVNHGYWLAETNEMRTIGVWESRDDARTALRRHALGLSVHGGIKPQFLIGESPR
jgi:hypothetical protein